MLNKIFRLLSLLKGINNFYSIFLDELDNYKTRDFDEEIKDSKRHFSKILEHRLPWRMWIWIL